MISIDEVRWIVRGLVASRVARRTWRAAVNDDGEVRKAAVILDLETGDVCYRYWTRDRVAIRSSTRVVLATTLATRREDVEAEARRGTEVPPSGEVIE